MANVYHHRALGEGGSAAGMHNARAVGETLDRIKADFELLANELTIARDQRERYETTIAAQTGELDRIRLALRLLEEQHAKVRAQYEYDLRALRAERSAPPPPPPPRIGTPARSALPSGLTRVRGEIEPSPRVFPSTMLVESPRQMYARERDGEHDPPRARSLEGGPNKRLKIEGSESARLPLIGPASSPHASTRRISSPLPPPRASAPPSSSGPFSTAASQQGYPYAPPTLPAYMNEFLTGEAPAEFSKDAGEWSVVYNPRVARSRGLAVGLLHTFTHETVVCCTTFSADGRWLATGCNRTTQVFEVGSGKRVCVLADESAEPEGDLYIRSARFSPDGRWLATGAEDERVRIWELDTQALRAVFNGHRQDIYALGFSPDGRRLVSGSGDASVRVWDLAFLYDAAPPASVRPGGHSHAGSRDARAVVIDTPTRVLTATPDVDDDAGVMSVALSPDGGLVAAGCVDGLVRIWEVRSGALVDVLRGHSNSVHSVVWRGEGSVLSGALDNSVRVWDLRGKKKKECVVFAGHKDFVLSVGLSRDAQWILSGSKDRGVHFWDSAGVVYCVLRGHKNSVISMSLHPTGNLLATGSGDKLARIWSYNTV
ncbi:chromatin associated protein [Mycena belliarum]|uniref:Chromatin associated protein n=1 Tax=Mycena belliarum TaxID=1033014 RepID=A0AAD6TRV2_9AGAR|nr:chromatin associated protein [Mycena belliae]